MILRIIVALLVLVAASFAFPPIVAEAHAQAVADAPAPVSRAKFPREDPAEVDFLAGVNRHVNRKMVYAEDWDHHGAADYWEQFPTDFKGDCEDYVLTKLGILLLEAFPVIDSARVTMLKIRAGGEEFGHVVLEVRLANGSVAVMDNNFDELMTRAELSKRGYVFQPW